MDQHTNNPQSTHPVSDEHAALWWSHDVAEVEHEVEILKAQGADGFSPFPDCPYWHDEFIARAQQLGRDYGIPDNDACILAARDIRKWSAGLPTTPSDDWGDAEWDAIEAYEAEDDDLPHGDQAIAQAIERIGLEVLRDDQRRARSARLRAQQTIAFDTRAGFARCRASHAQRHDRAGNEADPSSPQRTHHTNRGPPADGKAEADPDDDEHAVEHVEPRPAPRSGFNKLASFTHDVLAAIRGAATAHTEPSEGGARAGQISEVTPMSKRQRELMRAIKKAINCKKVALEPMHNGHMQVFVDGTPVCTCSGTPTNPDTAIKNTVRDIERAQGLR